MDDTLFGLYIKSELGNKILDSINKDLQPIRLCTLDGIPKIISSSFVTGIGFMDEGAICIKTCWESLTLQSHYPPEQIFISMLTSIRSILMKTLPITYYQNHSTPSGSVDQNVLDSCKKEAEEEIARTFLHFMHEVIFEVILIEPALKYKPLQKENALKRTYEILNSLTTLNQNDEFNRVIIHFNTLVENKPKTLLKKISKSKVDYLSCDPKHGLFYIHILNIIYSVFKIIDAIDNHKEIIDKLKDILHKVDNSESTFFVSNLIRDLTEFKKHVNNNQVLQYVSIYYHQNMLYDSVDFDDFKKLIALIFDKDPYKLFLNPLNIEKIHKPFEFLYYQDLVMFKQDSPYIIHVWQLCPRKKDIIGSNRVARQIKTKA